MKLPNQFNVKCSSIEESYKVQTYLFTLGFEWCSRGMGPRLTNSLFFQIDFSLKFMFSVSFPSLPTLTSAQVLPPNPLLRKHRD